MTPPRLTVITDWSRGQQRLLAAIERLSALGPRVAIQHRHPEAMGRLFLEEARLLAEVCARTGMPLFVNGRVDVALAVDAHLHLPAHGFSAEDVRPLLARDRWLSVAVHDAEEASRLTRAQAEGGHVSFALVSPVFGAGSKPGDTRTPLGADGFSELARLLPCPAHALGGITEKFAPALTGRAAGLAVVTAVLDAEDPLSAAETLLGMVAPA